MRKPEFIATPGDGENARSSHFVLLMVPGTTSDLDLIPVKEREP